MASDLSYVCISDARAGERRTSMADQFATRGVDVSFFDAFDLTDVFLRLPCYDRLARMRRYGRPMSRAEVGRYLGHRAVWHQLVHSGQDALCVMEDDIALLPGFCAATRELYDARAHWDIVRLTACGKQRQPAHAHLASGMKLAWSEQPAGLQCYMVTRAAARRLLDHTRTIVHAIDVALDRYWEHGQRMYVTHPPFAADARTPAEIAGQRLVPTLVQRAKAAYYRKTEARAADAYNRAHRRTYPVVIDTHGHTES
ncbi:glycosyltransferase family 25 protein [Burkholderia anthina]|uniref:glycosyltransferase family 25 protein n=1 Tax=Burkholderia anthina TaxID=179879 RepID=UPI00158B399C